jgi:hypothetical protein
MARNPIKNCLEDFITKPFLFDSFYSGAVQFQLVAPLGGQPTVAQISNLLYRRFFNRLVVKMS